MDEFTEYWAPDNSVRGGWWVTRKLPETTDGNCVVDHPDAGGPCGRQIVYEAYGLPFCGMHGLEAGAGALARLHHDAMDDFDRMDNPHTMPPQPEVLRVVREEIIRARDRHFYHAELRERFAGEAFELLRERVDAETGAGNPATCAGRRWTGGRTSTWRCAGSCSRRAPASRRGWRGTSNPYESAPRRSTSSRW